MCSEMQLKEYKYRNNMIQWMFKLQKLEATEERRKWRE